MNINRRIREVREQFCGGNNLFFANKLGKAPNTTSNWVRDGYSVGRGVASEISQTFGVNIEWLLTGEGSMLKEAQSGEENGASQEISSGKVIPYYDAEVAAGTEYGMEMTPTSPVGWIEIGGILKDSEFAMRVYGNSMVPNYPAGCVIGLRRYTEHFIEPGIVYVIETAENRFLKRLYYNFTRSIYFSCHTLHPSNFILIGFPQCGHRPTS